MKFSSVLALALAPMAMGKKVRNSYQRREAELLERNQSPAPQQLAPIGLQAPAPGNNAVTVVLVWYNMGGGAATQVVNNQVTVTQTVTVAVGGQPSVIPGIDGIATTVVPGSSAVIPGAQTTHSVTVGGPQGLRYSPDQLKASIGDIVVFTFLAQNHTVTQTTFGQPCVPMPGGMDSGFIPNADSAVNPAPQIAMQVMTENPIWMSCMQANHCGKGMVFSLNPSADQTHAKFQSSAIQLFGAGGGSAITGNGGQPAAPPPVGQLSSSLPPLPGATQSPVAPPGAQPPNVVSGVGAVLPDGSCSCSVTCGAGTFPDPALQGVGSFGGVPGSIPLNMVMA